MKRNNKMRTTDFSLLKSRGKKITMLTAYDYGMARLQDEVGLDAILVGDSLGMVMLGYETTVPVTMEEMLHHTKAVVRGVDHALVIADMPFMSFQVSVEKALEQAGRLLKEGGVSAVKLEGGREILPQVQALTQAGIPVLGHLGLTPQSVHQLGGYKVQGKNTFQAEKLEEDAHLLQDAGAFGIVLECVPSALAEKVSRSLSIPTIGIGAGDGCDGQVLVAHDLLGLSGDLTPKFVKRYANLAEQMKEAFGSYIKEVQGGTFPGEKESF
jgi:3-methyl-2-oxobutanoate hydroxymethyltransferase